MKKDMQGNKRKGMKEYVGKRRKESARSQI
jgi:hypothetical protein